MSDTPANDPSIVNDIAQLITAIGSLLSAVAWPAIAVGLIITLSYSTRARGYLANAVKYVDMLIQRGTKFTVGPVSIEVPAGIASDTVKSTTKEGVSGGKLSEVRPELIASLKREDNPDQSATYPYLLHSAVMQVPRTSPKSGRYSVRVWVEFDKNFGFGAESVKHVIYRLDNSWAEENRLISTAAAESQFELWISVYGEFTILAALEKTDGSVVWLSRYLDLPGRPPD
ncbi:pYEATS domain-containing protein [Dongia deserti]|uniref:pYEATS domain-containing protein n=1 Tax=Dongia deserti TaxID=2268030 RepID=UPI000E65C8CD|nr:pYEATS domain-containing protein [Dongia deserti]